ncbi:MAG: DUF366 family protein [Candidatus Krumholzibacteria bacterium]|nr:DUF366 family protein [Candidatus Krumholzibacteria bacterium]
MSGGYTLVETSWTGRALDYDGSQLRSHFIREETGLDCDAVIAFAGACDVRGDSLVDLEDAETGSTIISSSMLHFIGEHFQCPLREANFRLRLFVSIIMETVVKLAGGAGAGGAGLERKGDDLYIAGRKLTVAITTSSATSSVFHCGVNIDPAGAPVPAIGLEELGIDHVELAEAVLERYGEECASVEIAIRKVRGV